ncbi:HAD domain-containing protein [Micromonospora sp. NPDC047134]|uniref:HAD domain-containing protein n=1 Tax=Micromonospora sp. NPDC047134 TaxID=3154340 RepID=UPI003407A4C5
MPDHTTNTPAGRPGHQARPVVAIDVDGVLNPDHPPTARRLGYHPHHYHGPDPHGRQVSGVLWLHPDHGTWLRELAHHADLVWCTSWGPIAATWIAPRLNLPTDLPLIDTPHSGVRFGRQLKLAALYHAIGTRPVAVLDDEFGGRDLADATERTDSGSATLLVPVDSVTGLQRHHIDEVLRWLDGLAADTTPTHPPSETSAEPTAAHADGTSAVKARNLSVGDPVLRKSRLLSRQCDTCIFRPANLMHLSKGRLRDLVAETRRNESFIVCHDTLPHYRYPDAEPAICRGFADRYSTQALQIIGRTALRVHRGRPTRPASRPGRVTTVPTGRTRSGSAIVKTRGGLSADPLSPPAGLTSEKPALHSLPAGRRTGPRRGSPSCKSAPSRGRLTTRQLSLGLAEMQADDVSVMGCCLAQPLTRRANLADKRTSMTRRRA